MSRTIQKNLTSITDQDEFMRHASDVIGNIQTTINGKLEFSNMLTQQVDVRFTAVSSDVQITHGLKKRGVKYIVVDKSATCDIVHNSTNLDTNDYIVLRSTALAFVTLLLY